MERQLILANRYQNCLAMIHQLARDAVREATKDIEGVAELDREIAETLAKASEAEKKYDRKKLEWHAGKLDSQRYKLIKPFIPTAKNPPVGVVMHELQRIKDLTAERKAEARAYYGPKAKVVNGISIGLGLQFGTYQDREAAVDLALQTASGPQRKWQHYPEGTICAHFQTHTTYGDLPESNFAQIDPLPDDVRWDIRDTKKKRTRVRIRVGATGRTPHWVELPMLMHREIPRDARITWIKIQRERYCRSWRYYCLVTLELEDHRKKDGICTVLYRENTYCDRDGNIKSLKPRVDDIEARLKKSADIQSIRDNNKNEIRAFLASYLESAQVSAQLARMTRHIAKWQSCDRFHSLYWFWVENRQGGDNEILAKFNEWRKRDMHLWQYQEGLRYGALNQRKKRHEAIAADIKSHETIVFQKVERIKDKDKSFESNSRGISELKAMIEGDKKERVVYAGNSHEELRGAFLMGISDDPLSVLEGVARLRNGIASPFLRRES